jgi:acetoacetyl-CoA reductase
MARVALVTGGQRGIGAGISEALAKAGHKVVANYAGNDAAAQEFTGRTGIPCFKFDVGNFPACADAVKRIEGEVGPIDILVNNAGITRDTTVKRMTPEMWEAVIQTNLTSCWNLSKLVWDGMTSRKFGRIVNISSINGLAGQFGQSNYSAAKAGVIGLTKALAQEGARANITVNAIAPGYIDTEMVRAVAPDVLEKIIAKIPRARLGSVEDIARGVVFLAADEADWITGSTLSINGGQYMY